MLTSTQLTHRLLISLIALILALFSGCSSDSSPTVSVQTNLVLDVLERALYARPDAGRLLQHSDRGVQYVSTRYTERLAEASIEGSVGTVGDSYSIALAESIIGLYKTDVIRRMGPWRSLDSVEFATPGWVDWFGNRRLLEPIGNIPPIEFQETYYASQEVLAMVVRLN